MTVTAVSVNEMVFAPSCRNAKAMGKVTVIHDRQLPV